MEKFKKTYYIILVFGFILTLISCNYIIDNKETKAEFFNISNSNTVNNNKEQAKLLVSTSEIVVEVIKTCEVLEKAEIKHEDKAKIKEIKDTQLELLDSIKLVATDIMVTVPHDISVVRFKPVSDSLALKLNIKAISEKIKMQKNLANTLKSMSSEEKLQQLAITMVSKSEKNLRLLNN